MEKMSGETMNIVEDNIQKLKRIFPDVFNEDKVDFEKLERVLGNYKDDGIERYDFTWPGKGQARRISQTPSTGTLRPCKEESKNWDTTENLYIEGDNLEVLKLLQKSYYEKVKMIYIDPPYNTGNDFIYEDDFKDNVENYLAITGQKDKDGIKTTTNTESNGRYHSNWLNMMYPRLKLARNLLKDDGVIFISIDDNEVDNLKKVCNEILGENNFVATIVWDRKRGRDNSAKWFSKSHEYLLVFAKNKMRFKTNFLELDEETKLAYKNPDNDSRGIYRLLATWARGTQGGVEYEFENKEGKKFSRRKWLFSKENLVRMDKENRLIIRGENIYRKLFLTENRGKIPETIWKISNAANASDQIKNMFDNIIFDTPKPVEYIKEILKVAAEKNSLILDFFSGSATVADSIIQLNKEDNGKRKFVVVQIPEETDGKSEAYKAGYKNICEIGKERIRRAGEKITEENKDKEGIDDLDVGFKVFKLDSSNINKWDSRYSESLEESLLYSVDNIKDGRETEDILYEVLLKYGIDLNAPINEHNILGKKVYDIAEEVILCLEDNITLEHIEEIGKLKNSFDVESCRIVFMDSGFKDDVVKTNAIQVLKRYGIEDVKTI